MRYIIGKETAKIAEIEKKLEENKATYDSFISALYKCNVKVSAAKSLNLDVPSFVRAADFTAEEIENWINQAKVFYIEDSGIQANWLSENEKLAQIKKLDAIDKIIHYSENLYLPRLQNNKLLKKEYFEDYIVKYVYAPAAIEVAKNVHKTIKDLQSLNFKNDTIRRVLFQFGVQSDLHTLSSSNIEQAARVRINDKDSVANRVNGMFKQFKIVTKDGKIDFSTKEKVDYSPEAILKRTGIDYSRKAYAERSSGEGKTDTY